MKDKKIYRMNFGFPDPWMPQENEPVWGDAFGGSLLICIFAMWFLCTMSVAHAIQKDGMATPIIDEIFAKNALM